MVFHFRKKKKKKKKKRELQMEFFSLGIPEYGNMGLWIIIYRVLIAYSQKLFYLIWKYH